MGNIIKGFLILSFVIVLIFAWFLAVVRTFLHFDDVFSSFRPRFVVFLITWFFSLVMALFFPLSMLIGIMEMYQQWKCYKARKYMTKEQAKSTGNISIWAEAREGDKLKLIYVSLIYPLFGFLSLQKVLSTVYRLVWYRTNERIAFAAISFAIFYSYAFAIFIPLVIRFVLLRQN